VRDWPFRRIAATLGALGVALLTSLAIAVLSTHPYEWMVGERGDDGVAMTLCALPSPSDDSRAIGSGLMLVAVLPWFVWIALRWRQRAWTAWPTLAGLGLLAFWAYRFFGRYALC